jgi:hypothetical protein
MDEGGGLEGLAWVFVGQFGGSELAQLVIDERQQALGGDGVALLDLRQDTRDVRHGIK